MRKYVVTSAALAGAALAVVLGGFESNRTALAQNKKAVEVPIFEVDSKFPTLPDKTVSYTHLTLPTKRIV